MKALEIKNWLKNEGRNRKWLAEKCGVSKSTVNGWLSAGRSIPGPSRMIIDGLMSNRISINPKLSLEEFISIQNLAKKEGVELDEWIANLIRDANSSMSKE